MENVSGLKVKNVVSDNGGEFVNKSFDTYFAEKGIVPLRTSPYTPEQNPFAERSNRSVVEKARCLLKVSSLGLAWWAEAVNTAVYLLNRTPCVSVNSDCPYTLWFGTAPRLDHLRIFGCKVVFHLEKKWRKSKFNSSGSEGIMLGYVEGHKSYRVCFDLPSSDPFLPTVVEDIPMDSPSQSEVFHDPGTHSPVESVLDDFNQDLLVPGSPESESGLGDQQSDLPSNPKKGYEYVPHFSVAPKDISSTLSEDNILSSRFRSARGNHIIMEPSPADPITYQQAVTCKEAVDWVAAIDNELGNMERQGVWSITLLTPGARPISCKWVFKKKYDEDGLIEKFKARLVVRGFLQKEGIDFNRTFSPTGRLATLRTVLALAAYQDLDVHQMDVKCAFLNGKPDCDVFIKPPEGVQVKLKPGEGLKLNKSLYGLKQSPRMWHNTLVEFFKSIDFEPTLSDPCLFIHHSQPVTFIFVHVDDLVIGSKDVSFAKNALKNRFEMSDLGEIKYVLGMRVVRNRTLRTIFLVQDQYVKEMLEEYRLMDAKSVVTPLVPGLNSKEDESGDYADGSFDYRRAVGLLNYLVQCTRPDLAFTCSYLSQYLVKPTVRAVAGFFHCLRYLKGSSTVGIKLGSGELGMVAWADADWGGSRDWKSFSGSLVNFLGPIGWRCSKQPVTALSTCEAEHRASTEAGQDIIWLKSLLGELCIPFQFITAKPILFNDNQGAIALLENPLYQHKTRHVAIRLHWIRDHIDTTFILKYVKSAENYADFLTKSLSGSMHRINVVFLFMFQLIQLAHQKSVLP
ncbi:hypothetical protein PGT21_050324 [Puccinia graminis f. sp. tritici]|uniref:Integrase catalytic domain-containing protein n=2 Tax=Puccinia graminis f. sp. tritici TaxID=56615 RepID=A0A5B0M5T1_PUCGR|nr:hypothetical protein PGT21_050324 [Puccinia graminis f. sp. tritici]KAA1078516.1 hypothetical protein PGTUg99_050042 [Puccinia graminis f. sp. tritici]